MEEVLAFSLDDREDATKFINRVKKELNALSSANLAIPQHVLNQYVNDVDAVLNSQTATPTAISSAAPAVRSAVDDTVVVTVDNRHEEEDDYQDEFATEVQKRMAERQQKIETYQLNRLPLPTHA
jgi:hypothetical protein